MAGKFFYDGIKRIYGCGGVEKKLKNRLTILYVSGIVLIVDQTNREQTKTKREII